MCHLHPRYHPCNHTSLVWFFCHRAVCNIACGTTDVCSAACLATDQVVQLNCTLKHCHFKEKGGRWLCCECGEGPNTKGWCTTPRVAWCWDGQGQKVEYMTTCDHGCCDSCVGLSEEGFQVEDGQDLDVMSHDPETFQIQGGTSLKRLRFETSPPPPYQYLASSFSGSPQFLYGQGQTQGAAPDHDHRSKRQKSNKPTKMTKPPKSSTKASRSSKSSKGKSR